LNRYKQRTGDHTSYKE